MSAIYIVSVNAPDDVDLMALSEALSYTFQVQTKISQKRVDPEFAYDSSRGQFNSTEILAELLQSQQKGALKVLGITEVDLFIPVLTFVFGEAQLDGPIALVSTHRLRNQFYGLPKDGILLQERLEKEAIHELAHTFGLVHCPDQTCVLNSSTYVENIDLKRKTFCMSCREFLAQKQAPL
jgi:archaemetzincin